MICKYFLPLHRMSFYFADSVLDAQKFLIFMEFNMSIFAFVFYAFGVTFKK